MIRGMLALFGVAVVITVAWNLRADAPIPTENVLTAPKVKAPSAALGMQSCAASGCHGNPNAESLFKADAKDVWKSSFTHFTAVDPHTKAYAALKSPLAIEMAKKLKAGPGGTVIPAHEDVRCLACHTNPTLAAMPATKAVVALREEGVSCEACHGNAEDWRAAHTTWTTPALKAAAMPNTNFIDMKNDISKALVCADCHYGSGASDSKAVRDMNHDMIAAEHPTLDKGFEKLKSGLSAHWKARPEEPRTADTIDAFLVAEILLEKDRKQRNADGDPRTPWPEFASQNCVDCHHGLKWKNGP